MLPMIQDKLVGGYYNAKANAQREVVLRTSKSSADIPSNMSALASGVGFGGLTFLLGKYALPKVIRLGTPAALGAAGAVAGASFLLPRLVQYVHDEKEGLATKAETIAKIRELQVQQNRVRDAMAGILTRNNEVDMAKVSSFGSIIGGGLVAAGKGFGAGLKAVGGGLISHGAKRTTAQKAFGLVVKGGAVAGTVAAGNAIYQNNKYQSKPNYTTMLRNNMMAGNIDPATVNSNDINEVNKIGLN